MGLFAPAIEQILPGAQIDLLYIDVLHVKTEIRHSPRNPAIMAGKDAWHAGQRDATPRER